MPDLEQKKTGILPWIAAIAVVAIWGETFISSKIILEHGLAPSDIFFYRFLLAYVCIWPFSPAKLFSDNVADEMCMMLLGVTGGSLYFLAENTALVFSTASNTAILVGSAPLFTALLVAVFCGERMDSRRIAGSIAAFAGMALVIFNGKFVLKLNPLGDALALAAALMWALYSLLIRKVSKRYDVRLITRKVFFYGLLTIGLCFALHEPLNTDVGILSCPQVWLNLVYLGIVASLICFLVWNWALDRLGTMRTTNLIYGQCFFTMLISRIVLGEQITWMAVIGTVILVLGMINAVSGRE